MRIKVPLREAPFTQDKWIHLVDNGKLKNFFCKIVLPGTGKYFLYILPDGFPKELVHVIFGPNACIEEVGYKRSGRNHGSRCCKVRLCF